MRRKDREVTDLNQIFEIVSNCSSAHVGMIDNGKPYVVALNFGYERQEDSLILYFHSAYEGRKMDILKTNPHICFQMDCAGQFVEGTKENPFACTWKYASVIGSGTVEFLEDPGEKAYALNCMLRHLGKTEDTFSIPEAMLKKTCVYKICSRDFTGKCHG